MMVVMAGFLGEKRKIRKGKEGKEKKKREEEMVAGDRVLLAGDEVAGGGGRAPTGRSVGCRSLATNGGEEEEVK